MLPCQRSELGCLFAFALVLLLAEGANALKFNLWFVYLPAGGALGVLLQKLR